MYTVGGLYFLVLLCVAYADDYAGPQNGTVTLVRPNDSSNGPFSSGIVRMFHNDEWQSICSDSNFGQNEADVICHQLGFTEADSFSTNGKRNFGTVDNVVLSNVRCSINGYLALTQCSFSYRDDECNSGLAVTVACSSIRIWDDPYNGQLRLSGGFFSNDGVVEVYCNNEWGTVCSDGSFGDVEAEVVCDQLGYNDFAYYDSTSQNTSDVPIHFNKVDCSRTGIFSPLFCFIPRCKFCKEALKPSVCTSNKTVNVVCSHDKSMDNSDNTVERCDYSNGSDTTDDTNDDDVRSIEEIIGIAFGILFAVIVGISLVVLLPICLCFFMGVGVFATA